MINYIIGSLVVKDPTYVVVETNGGVGYEAKVSLATYTAIKDLDKVKLYTHLHVKEDAHTLYGFSEPSEKMRFLDLTSISGVHEHRLDDSFIAFSRRIAVGHCK